MTITIPELSLVVLIGASGAGKSTFARSHFLPTETLSSDACRALVSDDENNQAATKDAFELLHFIAAKRLAAGRLTVVDATNVQAEARRPLVALARQYHCLPVAIVFDLPESVCQDRNRARPDRNFGPHVLAARRPICAAPCGACSARASATSSSSRRPRKWPRRPSSASRSGTTARTIMAPSTSSATSMAAATSWKNCWGS